MLSINTPPRLPTLCKFFFRLPPQAALGAAYKTQTLLVVRLPAQTIKHRNMLRYTAGCFRKEKKSRPVQLLNSSSLPPKFPSQQIGTSHFPAVSSNSASQQNSGVVAQQLATNFALLSFPLLFKGTSGSFLQNLRHLDEQLIFSSAQLFYYYYSAALATVLNLSRGQTLCGSSQWFKLPFTVHSSRF